jgi:Golgi apparatus protein 1
LHVYVESKAPNSDQELAKKVLRAAQKQLNLQKAGPTNSSIVRQAPEAQLANGDGDISTTGPCARDRDVFCKEVPPGEGRIARCIRKQVRNEDKGNVTGRRVTDKCKRDVAAFYASRSKNINLNLGFATACKIDAAKFCDHLPKPGTGGAVLRCLRRHEKQLQVNCQIKVFHAKLAAAYDYRVDPDLAAACQKDVERVCSDVDDGEGRVGKCLV